MNERSGVVNDRTVNPDPEPVRGNMSETPKIITSEHVIYHFRPDLEPKWIVKDGELIEIHAPDGVHGQIQSEDDVIEKVDEDRINDAVGPIYVEGAMPGDTLMFDIVDVQVPSSQGYILIIPTFGLLQDYVKKARTKIVKIAEGYIHFNDLSIPVKPVIGTIGVAPAEGVWSTVYQHDFGGNMDCTDVCPGSRIYFPVFVPGGMLAMGDGKAVMGDGEVCSTGVGVPLVITGRVRVIKQTIQRPIIETMDEWMTIASANTVKEACRIANLDLINILQRVLGLTWEEAYMLTSLVADLRICQVVDPLMTVRMAISKKYLPNVFST